MGMWSLDQRLSVDMENPLNKKEMCSSSRASVAEEITSDENILNESFETNEINVPNESIMHEHINQAEVIEDNKPWWKCKQIPSQYNYLSLFLPVILSSFLIYCFC